MYYQLAVTLASAALFSSAILGGNPAAAQATEVAFVEEVIPSAIDQNPCAHWRNPMDMIRQG